MRRSSWLLGAVSAVLFMVGCGPPVLASKATPILFGASCPAESWCAERFDKCTEWSAPSSCGGASAQYQTCSDAGGNTCLNVALKAASNG
jgi:hypothetical protein